MLPINKVRARLAKRTPCDPGCPGWMAEIEKGHIEVCDACNRSLAARLRLSDADVQQLPEAQAHLEQLRVTTSIQRAIQDAKRHGDHSDPDHEVGDLVDVIELLRRLRLTKLLPPCPTCGYRLRLCASVDTACSHCDQCDWCGDPFSEGEFAGRDGCRVLDVRSGAVIAECPDAMTAEQIKNALNGDTDE